MRDEFSAYVRRTVAARVGSRCSNPDCDVQVSGPQVDPTKAVNIGVAAHITAASPDGPRYDPSLTSEERRSIHNAILLCQKCATLIDTDPVRFPVDMLRQWKISAEATAFDRLLRPTATATSPTHAINQIWNVPYQLNRFFTGRQQELDQIREALFASGISALTQPQAISGLGGIGKTQTAVEYAYRWHKEYKAVLWVKADSHESLVSTFVEIARLLSLPEADAEEQSKTIEAVLYWLRSNSDWLLIFDNADDVNLIEDFMPTKYTGHILITSRGRVFGKLGVTNPVYLEKMLPDEAEKLLQKRAERKEIPAEESRAVERLARELDYLPLALEQAGAYINKMMCSFGSYLKCYADHGLSLLEKSGADVGKYPKSVATTWLLNFEQVEQTSQASADFLRASAFLGPDSIPLEILVNGAEELGPAISAKLSEIDSFPLAIDELIQPISDYSLISRDVSAQTYSIHRLVQAVLRQQLNEETQRLWAERVIRAINETMPGPGFSTRQEFARFLPHAQTCSEYIERFNLTSEEAQHILLIIGKYYSQQNRLDEAEQYCLRALSLSEKSEDEEQVEMMAQSLVNLGGIYFIKAKYVEAESILLRALGMLEKDPKKEPLAFASCLNTLGELYRTTGRYADAKKYYEGAAPTFEFMLTLNHPSTTLVAVEGLNNLAEFYRITSSYKAAEPLYKKLLKIIEKTFTQDHPALAMILNNLGEFYRQQGSHSKAAPYYQRAIKIQEGLEGAERSYDLATSLSNLGLAYYFLGRHDEAESLLLRSIAIEEKVLGSAHPRLAQGLNNLALIRSSQSRYDEAISLYERAISIWKESLGPDHPEVARGLDNLGKVYHALGNYVSAESLHKQALRIMEKVFGSHHEETRESVTNLWALYYEQQRYTEAKPYFDRAIRGFMGTNDVDYSAMARIASSYATELHKKKLNFEARKYGAFAKELKRHAAHRTGQASSAINTSKKKVGRNDPCPCGSGQKFKKCCGA